MPARNHLPHPVVEEGFRGARVAAQPEELLVEVDVRPHDHDAPAVLVEALRRVVRAAHELGILHLTIFSFSSENWSRPATEIGDLFGLLRRFIRNDLATLHRDGVRVRVIGERQGLEADICALLNEAEELTRDNTRLNLVVAFNYGSRQEIARAAQRMAQEVAEGKRDPASIDADQLGRYLDAPDIPDPDQQRINGAGGHVHEPPQQTRDRAWPPRPKPAQTGDRETHDQLPTGDAVQGVAKRGTDRKRVWS